MGESDKTSCHVVESKIQDVDISIFSALKKGDILFVDSSHVVKTGSDVHFILFSILPVLESGVIIHFHDVFYPFEYPKKWVYKGFNWNEDYFLRAFMMHNNAYKLFCFLALCI